MMGNAADDKIILNPGDVYVSLKPARLWTVLGSCISIILYSPIHKAGAMCHAQLPEKIDNGYKCSDFCPNPCYYDNPGNPELKHVSCALRYMVNELNAQGISANHLEAYVYGGADRFNIKIKGKGIGEQNQIIARDMLKKYGITIKKIDVGGKYSRRIEFNSGTGEISIAVNSD